MVYERNGKLVVHARSDYGTFGWWLIGVDIVLAIALLWAPEIMGFPEAIWLEIVPAIMILGGLRMVAVDEKTVIDPEEGSLQLRGERVELEAVLAIVAYTRVESAHIQHAEPSVLRAGPSLE